MSTTKKDVGNTSTGTTGTGTTGTGTTGSPKQSAPKTLKFPQTLNKNRHLQISVFDLDYLDTVNAAMAGVVKTGVNTLTTGVNDIVKSKGVTGVVLQSAKSVVKGLVGIVGGKLAGITGTFEGIKANIESGNFKDFGNTPLKTHNGNWKQNIFLPLPNNLSESVSHTYKEAGGWLEDLPGFTMPSALTSPIQTAVETSNLVSKTVGTHSMVKNENKISMYESTAFRTISLEWVLIPNNSEEAKQLHYIIASLKAFSAPQSIAGKSLLRSPHFFQLKFSNKVVDGAIQMRECVITSVNVNYSTDGNMETFVDNMPKAVTLTVEFQEREPKTMEDWNKSFLSDMGSKGIGWTEFLNTFKDKPEAKKESSSSTKKST